MIIDRGRIVAAGPLDEFRGHGQTLEDIYLELTESEST
jgi:hypothetical protein